MMAHYIEHRHMVVRRTQYDLRKAEERAHILQGSSSLWTTLTRSSP